MRRLAFLLAAASLAACDSPIVRDDYDLIDSFSATSELGAGNPPVVTATAVNGRIQVDGTAATPCGNYGLRAEASKDGAEVTVEIVWRSEPACATMIGGHRYRAVLDPLAPGSYRVTVVQRILDGTLEWPATSVLAQEVVIQ
ncbi:MAG TPA: hypothetical protein VFQ39_01545 [Longimicrobium sp.]|nr:hypothetical protein [Longimicrobium sp.]